MTESNIYLYATYRMEDEGFTTVGLEFKNTGVKYIPCFVSLIWLKKYKKSSEIIRIWCKFYIIYCYTFNTFIIYTYFLEKKVEMRPKFS